MAIEHSQFRQETAGEFSVAMFGDRRIYSHGFDGMMTFLKLRWCNVVNPMPQSIPKSSPFLWLVDIIHPHFLWHWAAPHYGIITIINHYYIIKY
jgi:hypothetical protein